MNLFILCSVHYLFFLIRHLGEFDGEFLIRIAICKETEHEWFTNQKYNQTKGEFYI